LDELVKQLASVPVETLTAPNGITPERAQTLLDGTLLLVEIARWLGTDLVVGRPGLREGAAIELARAEIVAA
jgi:exopolyphosphatase/pppGpp-phosphohydrolase